MSGRRKAIPAAFAISVMAASAPAAFAHSKSVQKAPRGAISQNESFRSLSQNGVGNVTAELKSRGYQITHSRRTILGRYLIRAEHETHLREVLFNRETGKILKDLIIRRKLNEGADVARRNGLANAPAIAGGTFNGKLDASVGAAGVSANVNASVPSASEATSASASASAGASAGSPGESGGGASVEASADVSAGGADVSADVSVDTGLGL